MNYYEKHIGDYIRDTVSLSMLEDGAYNRLMDQCYQTERPLPADKKMVYRLARATTAAERKAVDFVVETFFTRIQDGYIQKRIQAEIERYQEKQRKAKASADARWNKTKSHSEGNANASRTDDAPDMRTHCGGNAHQTPDTRHHIHTDADAPKKYSMRDDLIERGIPERLAKDWLECRKAKKLANTLTAMEGVLSEVEKAGITLEAALKTCCERGWGGFKATWMHGNQTSEIPELM